MTTNWSNLRGQSRAGIRKQYMIDPDEPIRLEREPTLEIEPARHEARNKQPLPAPEVDLLIDTAGHTQHDISYYPGDWYKGFHEDWPNWKN